MPDTQAHLNPSINRPTNKPRERRNVDLASDSHVRITFRPVVGSLIRVTKCMLVRTTNRVSASATARARWPIMLAILAILATFGQTKDLLGSSGLPQGRFLLLQGGYCSIRVSRALPEAAGASPSYANFSRSKDRCSQKKTHKWSSSQKLLV